MQGIVSHGKSLSCETIPFVITNWKDLISAKIINSTIQTIKNTYRLNREQEILCSCGIFQKIDSLLHRLAQRYEVPCYQLEMGGVIWDTKCDGKMGIRTGFKGCLGSDLCDAGGITYETRPGIAGEMNSLRRDYHEKNRVSSPDFSRRTR